MDQKPVRGNAEFNFPFAAAPDIIRSTQKDQYFQNELFDHLSNILRRLNGVRFLHKYEEEAKTASNFLYLALTTLLGNRTLGEEYCDIVQIENSTMKLPSLQRRAGYIVTTILLPYTLTRTLPSFRRKARARLEAATSKRARNKSKAMAFLQNYLLENLDTLTSPAPIYAVSLAFFYFSGAYYQLGKRIWGLRYVFTKKLGPGEARVGYEVLGVLLVAQMVIQSWLHVNSTWQGSLLPQLDAFGGGALTEGGVELEFDPDSLGEDDGLTMQTNVPSSDKRSGHSIAKLTHTPATSSPHFSLEDDKTLKWIDSEIRRKCVLCLEPMKDPSVTQCGHMFCWTCINDWCREKSECPLCRQTSLAQHILPLRG